MSPLGRKENKGIGRCAYRVRSARPRGGTHDCLLSHVQASKVKTQSIEGNKWPEWKSESRDMIGFLLIMINVAGTGEFC